MQLYQVEIEETRRRFVSAVAPSAQKAERLIRQRLTGPGRTSKIIAVSVADAAADAASGQAALAHLLTTAYLPLDGECRAVGSWLIEAAPEFSSRTISAKGERINQFLAHGGMRVYGADKGPVFYVANWAGVTFLQAAFEGTGWADGRWAPALRAIEGAERTALTFAGMRSRAVGVPLQPILDAVKEAGDD